MICGALVPTIPHEKSAWLTESGLEELCGEELQGRIRADIEIDYGMPTTQIKKL